MPANDELGDRMKMYEAVEAQRRAPPGLPVLARLDGRAFHTWTTGLPRPFCAGLVEIMQQVTERLVKETNALVGYTQSDEITLVLYTDRPKSQLYFDGRIQKMTSVLAAFASVHFNRRVPQYLPNRDQPAYFDCRVWTVPSLEEAANAILWREIDATKNSISMVAQSRFSHKQLHGKNTKEMQEMLWQVHGVNWSEYPDHLKRGSYFRRVTMSEPFTTEELEALPPKHAARVNPELVVERSSVQRVTLPPMGSLRVGQRVDVLFKGASVEGLVH